MSLWALAAAYLMLAVVSVGGPGAALSTAHAVFVDLTGAVTPSGFSGLFGLASAAPGPNIIFFVTLAYSIEGWLGLAIATVCYVIPLAIMAGAVGWAGERFRQPWVLRLHRGLHPVIIGLCAYGAVVAGAPLTAPAFGLVAAGVAVLLLTKVNPAVVVLGLALIGGVFFGYH